MDTNNLINENNEVGEMNLKNEIEKISKEYWKEIEKLKKRQVEIINEYVSKLEEKKKEEIMRNLI